MIMVAPNHKLLKYQSTGKWTKYDTFIQQTTLQPKEKKKKERTDHGYGGMSQEC